MTNKTLVAQYRGAGRPEATFALERGMDAAARELGLSGVEIRRRNLLTADDLPYPRPIPYRDGVPIVYDGKDYTACLESVLTSLPASEADALAEAYPDHRIGYGLACYMEATGRGPHETARVRLLPNGRFEATAGAASAGQGHETTFAQIAADALEVPLEAGALSGVGHRPAAGRRGHLRESLGDPGRLGDPSGSSRTHRTRRGTGGRAARGCRGDLPERPVRGRGRRRGLGRVGRRGAHPARRWMSARSSAWTP